MSAPAAEIAEKFRIAFGSGDTETAQKPCERVGASGEFALRPNVHLPIDDERAVLPFPELRTRARRAHRGSARLLSRLGRGHRAPAGLT
ncbi:hypothetical protein FHX82_007001 [Amycolatopsis bartoniae]|uniref:Uncharacterized protein n=1 Tax=Amycolatopsis bartoniae TaxID=941986 RepID=A0A8H9ISE2_9PSEU|nr:hypothetical protein [Amycolatopsis bartoniae]MBB2939915.1 hypothetical protein [Amycolatopsis bartoniae]TVT08301.1 hypothetical protein FNH07_12790 [Amycolatopsis bartoniae]GHF35704.1 hypothetical protein GCM10017566_05800 [Amycolatopsis bartoniae]